jgi:hypothetical protein
MCGKTLAPNLERFSLLQKEGANVIRGKGEDFFLVDKMHAKVGTFYR